MNLVVIGSHGTPGTAHDVWVDGNVGDGIFAYVANGETGLHIFDVTDSSSPHFVGQTSIAPGTNVKRVEVADMEAYKEFHTDVLGALPTVNSITSYIVMGSPKDERA